MSDNIIEFDFGRKPPPIDPLVIDSLELLRIFHRAIDPAQRRAIIRMLDYMLPDYDSWMSDGVYPPRARGAKKLSVDIIPTGLYVYFVPLVDEGRFAIVTMRGRDTVERACA